MSDAGPVRAMLVSVVCFFRAVPLWFRASPRTPLRVLGIVAFDTLHVLRYARPLPRRTITELAMFLDFEGCANAACDQKAADEAECHATRKWLECAGLGPRVEEYLRRLRALETARPLVGGDRRRFDVVRSYREAVATLALTTVATWALTPHGSSQDLDGLQGDADTDTLFRILMQCQIIDDVLDYAADASARLPSFLTAASALPQALALTADAVRVYAGGPPHARRTVLPLRVALWIFTAAAAITVHVAGWRHRDAHQAAHR